MKIAGQEPPSLNDASNASFRDVIGSKLDDHDGDSLASILHILNEHVHTASKVYPTLADGVAVASHADAWTLGSFVEIVPADTITSIFDIHHVSVEALDDNTVYELVLYYGETDIEAGRVRFTKNANLDAIIDKPVHTPLIPANSKIRAKLASAAGNSSATISIFYHTY
jgi:hypothetical protein